MDLLGIQKLDFSNSEGRVRGYKLFFTYKDVNVVGVATDSKFFGSDSPFYNLVSTFVPGMTFKFELNPKGRVMDVIPLLAPDGKEWVRTELESHDSVSKEAYDIAMAELEQLRREKSEREKELKDKK